MANIMNTNKENRPLNDPTFLASIVRSPDEGPNYQPNWRWLTVQKYLAEIESSAESSADRSKKLELILDREKEEVVRQTLQFHCGVLGDGEAPVKYALLCAQDATTAGAIMAMVVAKASIERIAIEMGTQPGKIEFFEKLYFDVRPYLGNRFLLRKICFGNGGHRWLKVAFLRGWAGVEEIVLQRLPNGPRNLSHTVSVLLGRAQAHQFELEASNAPESEKDLQLLLSVSQANAKFPFLQDTIEENPVPETEASKGVAELTPVGRERVAAFLRMILDEAKKKERAARAQSERNAAHSESGIETELPPQSGA